MTFLKIYRDYHGYAEDEEHVEEKPQEKRDSRTEKEDIVIMRKAVHEDRSPFDKEENRPTPPQFIDLHQVENKSHVVSYDGLWVETRDFLSQNWSRVFVLPEDLH